MKCLALTQFSALDTHEDHQTRLFHIQSSFWYVIIMLVNFSLPHAPSSPSQKGVIKWDIFDNFWIALVHFSTGRPFLFKCKLKEPEQSHATDLALKNSLFVHGRTLLLCCTVLLYCAVHAYNQCIKVQTV